MRDREVEPVAAFLGLIEVRVALGIVDELVVGEVMQAERVGRRVDRGGAQPVRCDLAGSLVGKQHVVRTFVDRAAQLMLRGAH